MNRFAVHLDVEGPETVIRVVGEIDLAVADKVKSTGLMALTAPNVSAISFDLSQVTFLDSTGIGALIAVRNAADDADVKVRIDKASDAVMRVLEITALAPIFGVAPVDP